MDMISSASLTVDEALDCRAIMHKLTLKHLEVLFALGLTTRKLTEIFSRRNSGPPDWEIAETYDDVVQEHVSEIADCNFNRWLIEQELELMSRVH